MSPEARLAAAAGVLQVDGIDRNIAALTCINILSMLRSGEITNQTIPIDLVRLLVPEISTYYAGIAAEARDVHGYLLSATESVVAAVRCFYPVDWFTESFTLQWEQWIAKGKIAPNQFPPGSLEITSIAIHYSGPGAGHQVLSLGSVVVDSGPDWKTTRPLCAVVVQTDEEKYFIGRVLEDIPEGAVPVEFFFG